MSKYLKNDCKNSTEVWVKSIKIVKLCDVKKKENKSLIDCITESGPVPGALGSFGNQIEKRRKTKV